MTYTEAKKAIQASDKDTVKELLKDYSEEVLLAAIECDVNPADIPEAYQGEHSSDKDFAQNMAVEFGLLGKNIQWPYTCIDWDHAAKELMYDYCESNGHYFRKL
jgi:antirestriction protein